MLRLFLGILFFKNLCYAESFFKEVGEDLASPLTTEARDYMDLGLTSSAFLYVFFKNDFILALQGESVKHKPLGESAPYGDYGGQIIPNALYAGGMYTSYLLTDDKDFRRFASQMFRATLYSSLVTTVLKYTVPETRPDKSDRQSFPSGHATTAFAFASVVAMNHKWYWGVPAYAFASFVGYSRMNDNKHYLHDVTVGATIGLVYGMGIYYTDLLREQKNNKDTVKPPSFFITPTLVPQGLGFLVVKRF